MGQSVILYARIFTFFSRLSTKVYAEKLNFTFTRIEICSPVAQNCTMRYWIWIFFKVVCGLS